MTEKKQIYKCQICGNIVEVLHEASAPLFCCGEPMQNMEENTEDASNEKHVPIIERVDGSVIVKVGSVEHPSDEEHHIEWIEITSSKKSYKKFLKAGDKPEAEFKIDSEDVVARAYCNLHGLWRSK
ncbi:desulfoferrodoxin [archaeon]|jgi:superoxide reductase|nr:desulfoferrodoxin [archaeon]MBT6824035.1 desulfoferrodoxin [archaeon]MBT7107268.1 desulfoferrodoxin [archaeon]MBT7297189.1 desulfoferrodoxin [archaeon]